MKNEIHFIQYLIGSMIIDFYDEENTLVIVFLNKDIKGIVAVSYSDIESITNSDCVDFFQYGDEIIYFNIYSYELINKIRSRHNFLNAKNEEYYLSELNKFYKNKCGF